MILDEIKKANIDALRRKDSISRGIFSVTLNKIKLEEIRKRESSEEVTEADVINIIQKTIKELAEDRENYKKVNNEEMVNETSAQMGVLLSFLPKMMSEDEIKSVINSLEDKSIGNVMKHFRTEYAGKCDMKMVSDILRTL